ncbi:MAG: ParB/RepB/Spo0J family partition protein [Kouleothrix sp.]|jgi:ParB family chromosome partitioning protein|nr:ParB/RepB/Spo0J family partition protein [Kouleothrix sp.]
MPPKRKSGFFGQPERPEDTAARQSDLAAVLTKRLTFPQEIAVDLIERNPFQARTNFTDIAELAQAIRQQGFTSRLRVRQHPTEPRKFQLLYGERRLLAARQAGLDAVPCDVADHTDDELIEIGLAENIQRRDLDPLEEARAFQTFIGERGYSIRRLAERIGKDKSYVEDRLKLLQAPADVQQMVAERPDSLRAAREIAKIESPEDRAPLIAGVVGGALSTAEVRGRVAEAKEPVARPPTARPAMDLRGAVERDARTVQAILDRWQVLADQDEAARDAVRQRTEDLLRTIQRLVDAIDA